MKTHSNASAPARRPRTVREAAPSLVNGGKVRAKKISPAPLRMIGGYELPEHEQAVIDAAMGILRNRLRQAGAYAGNPSAASALAVFQLGMLGRECFMVFFLDAQLGVIATEELSLGTLTQTTVYPREVVRAAMRHNAAAVILAHNHPSGKAEPSKADKSLTVVLQSALDLVDVRVLDHLIVAGDRVSSFAERGLM